MSGDEAMAYLRSVRVTGAESDDEMTESDA